MDPQIGTEYHLSYSTLGTLVGFLETEDGEVACFQIAGQRTLHTEGLSAPNPFPRVADERSRESVRHYHRVHALGLVHLAADVAAAVLDGRTSITEPIGDAWAQPLQNLGYTVSRVELPQPACVYLGQWVRHGYQISWG